MMRVIGMMMNWMNWVIIVRLVRCRLLNCSVNGNVSVNDVVIVKEIIGMLYWFLCDKCVGRILLFVNVV